MAAVIALAPRSSPAGHRTRPLTRGWQQSRTAAIAGGERAGRSPACRPDAVRDLGHEAQLVLLVVLADRVARSRRGEAALRRQRELFTGEETARLADPGGQLVGWLHGAELRRDHAEHDHH